MRAIVKSTNDDATVSNADYVYTANIGNFYKV